MKPFTASWWGRVGEILYLHLYPQASDAAGEFGNTVAFDVQHPEQGRVNVKTSKESKSRHGLPVWKFQIEGVRDQCDGAFLIGFTGNQQHVAQAWFVPSETLPARLKSMSPSSKEYKGRKFESSDAVVTVLDYRFQMILKEVGKTPTPSSRDQEPMPYDRVLLGIVGEAIYQKLSPASDHVAARNPLAPHDFLDADGVRVNVRVRRLSKGKPRWTFFRSDGDAQVYFFIGMDRQAREVMAFFRVPASEMPGKGFSVSPTGTSRWNQYRVEEASCPSKVAALIEMGDLEGTHLEIQGLTQQLVGDLTDGEQEALLIRAFKYHRLLGFPYPKIPYDKLVHADMTRLRAYQPDGWELPRENAGLGLCSSYMPHRFESRNSDADFSAKGAFESDDRLMRSLRFCLKGKTPGLTRNHLRSSLTALNRTPVNFRPAVAKALVETYSKEGDTVLDPCAGWGGRLVGTLAARRRYVGVEPVEDTYNALYRLGMRLCECLEVNRGVVQVFHDRVQTVPLGDLKVAFALSSPPFWAKEVYDGDSSERESLQDWKEEFLVPFFERVREKVLDGGRFAVHMADVKMGGKVIPLEKITIETACACGWSLERTWRMWKSSFGGQKRAHDPILIFR